MSDDPGLPCVKRRGAVELQQQQVGTWPHSRTGAAAVGQLAWQLPHAEGWPGGAPRVTVRYHSLLDLCPDGHLCGWGLLLTALQF
jgi:hypothetical protein